MSPSSILRLPAVFPCDESPLFLSSGWLLPDGWRSRAKTRRPNADGTDRTASGSRHSAGLRTGQSPGARGTPPTSPFPPGVPFPVPAGPFPPGFPPPGFPPPVVIIPSNTSVMPRVENLDQAIELLKSGDASYKNAYPPLSKLREWPVDAKRRNEVAGLLDPFLTAENATVRHYAQEAAKGWGTPKNVPTLLKLLDWQDSTDRSNGIRAPAAIGGKEAAQAIASKLDEKSTHVEARRALARHGSGLRGVRLALYSRRQ